jgi:phenylalanyl-tRNA synthetase beta chain
VRILLEHLRTYIDMPGRLHDARELLDDVGIEVKTADVTSLGTVFNLELLANRGDHYCYAGIAREVSGRTGGRLKYPTVAKLNVERATEERVRIESPLCLRYTVTELFAPAATGVLPSDVLLPLTAADIHSISASVDASNLANLEIGQPTHAFDADTIDGPIIIRTSTKSEKAWMLFTPEAVEIPEGTLVIADRSKILGIAGVIGCVESSVTDRTTRILLESATFDPVTVRIASRQLNQPTDAAARFMRGGDPSAPLLGAARVAHLLEKHSGYRIGNAYTAGDWQDPQRTIEVHVAAMRHFIGAELTALQMADRLTRYGFAVIPSDGVIPSEVEGSGGVGGTPVEPSRRPDASTDARHDTLEVIVPPHRIWDVHFEADLAEELVKSVGYNNTVVTLPHVKMGALPSHEENVASRVNEVLVAEGFYEIFTNSFYSPRMRERLGVGEGDPLWPHVEMQNSIEKDYGLMRNNTLAQALDALVTNLNLKTANLKIYEWARIYFPDLSEQAILWGLVNGRDRGPFWGDKGRAADASYVKGILEQLRLELRVDIRLGSSEGHRLERFFHPGRRAGIHISGALRGILGEIHPTVLQRFDVKRQRPVYFELETASLYAPPLPKTYAEPPSRQAVVRNVAYAIPRGTTAEAVRQALLSAAPEFLREIRITDLFELPEANAVTFEIEYLAERPLTNEEVNAATEAMMAAVKAKLPDVTLRA